MHEKIENSKLIIYPNAGHGSIFQHAEEFSKEPIAFLEDHMVKTILITGATDGIGKHLAKKLANKVIMSFFHGRNPQNLELALQEVRAVSLRGRVSSYLRIFQN